MEPAINQNPCVSERERKHQIYLPSKRFVTQFLSAFRVFFFCLLPLFLRDGSTNHSCNCVDNCDAYFLFCAVHCWALFVCPHDLTHCGVVTDANPTAVLVSPCRNDYVALSVGRRYLGSVYWALTTLTTVGYGDISARTTDEQVQLVVPYFFFRTSVHGVGWFRWKRPCLCYDVIARGRTCPKFHV